MTQKDTDSNFQREKQQWIATWALISSHPKVGEKILKAMQSFVSVIRGQRLPDMILNRHAFNLWLLCGEIVKYVQDDNELKSLSSDELILRFVDAEGGPTCAQLANEQEQRRFDATCLKLFNFLTMPNQE